MPWPRYATALAQLGHTNVEPIQADINHLEPTGLSKWQPFDRTVCRLLLMHQHEPAETLWRAAEVIRPGGRIVAQDPWPDVPHVDPPVPALARIRDLPIAHLRHSGEAYDVAWDYGEVCHAAGLRLLDWRGTVAFAHG